MIKKIFSTISLLTVLISIFSVNAFAIGPSYTKWERLLMLITESPLMTTFFIIVFLLALSLGITILKIIKIQRKNIPISSADAKLHRNIKTLANILYFLLLLFLVHLDNYIGDSVMIVGVIGAITFYLLFIILYLERMTRNRANMNIEELSKEEKSLNMWITIPAAIFQGSTTILFALICFEAANKFYSSLLAAIPLLIIGLAIIAVSIWMWIKKKYSLSNIIMSGIIVLSTVIMLMLD